MSQTKDRFKLVSEENIECDVCRKEAKLQEYTDTFNHHSMTYITCNHCGFEEVL